jgi:hypothetical protein
MTVPHARSRGLGTFLVGFGLVGIILAGALAATAGGAAIATGGLDEQLATQRTALAATVRDASFGVGKAAVTIANIGGTLDTTETVLRDTSDALDDLATAADDLAASLDISILGQRPFEDAASSLATFADRLASYADGVEALASDLVANQADLEDAEEQLRALQTRLDTLAEDIEAGTGLETLVAGLTVALWLLAAVAAWAAVGGATCAWVGWRLRSAS